MQEEIEHKTVNFAISTVKLSARTLLKGAQFFLRQYDKSASQGKQSMKRLIRQNRETFHACNLTLVEGRAPAALADLPAPDAVFIGGTKGGMEAVVDTVLARNPNARICISAIALETLSAAVAALTAHGLAAEVTQIAVSRTRPAGRLHLLMANNPIFLITGERK